jgi:hypothetical protein
MSATRGFKPALLAKRGTGFLFRLMQSIHAARQRQADREIARYISARGGYLTDETELGIALRSTDASHRLGL